MSDLSGRWVTIKGRRVFIKDGQDLSSAMKDSGKFGKSNNKENTRTLNDDKEIIGKGSTGEVIKDGDKVYKNSTGEEYKVIEMMKDNDNVIDAELVNVDGKDMIEMDYYRNIVSVDEVPLEKRQKYGNIMTRDRIDGMINAVNEMSEKNISYNDPLHFAFANEDGGLKPKLFDFSMAKIEAEPTYADNYFRLYQYLEQFGAKGEGAAIIRGINLYDMVKSNHPIEFTDGVQKEVYGDILGQMKNKGIKDVNNVYYTNNARPVEIGEIIQTDNFMKGSGKSKYIFSDRKLTDEEIKEWELRKLYVKK